MLEQNLTYVPLHVHSYYSIKDGLDSVEKIVAQAKKFRIPALALTDISNICGYIKFYLACKNAGIKPIMGAEIEVIEDKKNKDKEERFTLTLLAMDRVGRQNLYDILSKAWLSSKAGAFNAATNLEDLAIHSQGLIVLNGFRGDIAKLIYSQNLKKIDNRIAFYKKYFDNRFCFEITRTDRENESIFEQYAIDLCIKHNIAPVATNDTVFLNGPDNIPEDGFSDYEIHDIRVSIYNGVQRGNKEFAKLYSPQQYLKSPQQMQELFADMPEAIANTRAIAARCNVEIELDHPRLPHYPTGELSAAEYLRKAAYDGLMKRLDFLFKDEKTRKEKEPIYVERLNVELDVIIKMDFPGYFLIVMEFIQWSKDHDVPVGPGRGSGGGSLVAYALQITDFDPLRFDLLFERFLNPERVSMPDFDVDFCQRNREKTLEHVKDRYGTEAVSQIATFGTMAPKAAIKDAGRALGMAYGAVDYVAKQLPTVPGLTFKAAFGIDKKGNKCESAAPDFVALYEQAKINEDKARVDLIHIAMRLEGVVRNIGKHAAGVVIAPTRTAEFTPLMLDSDGNSITQFDKKDVEHAGLVKFDFLGLTTLTIIADAVTMINRRKALKHEPLLNVADIPYEDEESFKVIQQCETTAVFQLESPGMRKLIGQMKPDRFDDLIALVALYRPGPIKSGMVQHFVDRKHGIEEVSYPQPDFQDLDLKPILDSTYGVIVYQEQVMQIAQVLAGYSLGGADILRRAMGKKNPAEMASQRSVFRDGAIAKHKDPDIAMKIFDQVEMFAEYGFNKSHSAAYALVAWWTLYLKTHYPAEFLAAMMTADRQRVEKLVSYIADCYRLKIKVNPPDVQVGRFDFSVNDKGEVVYGIGAIKGIGEEIVTQIVKSREEDGPFSDIFDFAKRTGALRLNKKTLEAFIMCGALDSFGQTRATLYHNIDNILKYAQQENNNNETGMMDLFANLADAKPSLTIYKEWSDKIILNQEQRLLGLYLSGHPILEYLDELHRFCNSKLAVIRNLAEKIPKQVTCFGVVISIIERTSNKDGSKFYIITLDDSTSQLEIVLYQEEAAKFSQILKEKEESSDKNLNKKDITNVASPLILIVQGRIATNEDGSVRFKATKLDSLEHKRRINAKNICYQISTKTFEKNASKIIEVIEANIIDQSKIQNQSIENNEDFDNEIIQGCNFNLILDKKNIYFKNNKFKVDPKDNLIEKLKDLSDHTNSISINYE